MKQILKDNLLAIIGGVLGAIGGYIYYVSVGCKSGSCPITSSPYLSIIWGGLMGGLILSMFKKSKNK